MKPLISGEKGLKDGQLSSAQFSACSNIACFLQTGDLYVTDPGNNRIRKISPNGEHLLICLICLQTQRNG